MFVGKIATAAQENKAMKSFTEISDDWNKFPLLQEFKEQDHKHAHYHQQFKLSHLKHNE